jgi:hypothetical protein
MFMGASSLRPGHGLFTKWTRLLQRFFSRLPTHFFHVGFKLRGVFCRLSRLFPRLRSSFYRLPRLVPRMLKFFPRLLRVFHNLHVLFLKHLNVPRFYLKLFRLFHKLHEFFGMLVVHAFS